MSGDRLADQELVELLRDSPDLLAVAEAIATTQRPQSGRRGAKPLRFAAVAVVLITAAVLALVAPWEGRGGGFVQRALAALGDGQVIHVVSVTNVPQTVLDLESGAEIQVRLERELWFDERRALRRTVTRQGGAVTGEALQTPAGYWTQDGRVYTCAWIAAHPEAATRAGVSCNFSGENGSRPRKIPEPRPTLEPTLAGFVSGYRDALANGTATRDGSGVVEGRPVVWLRFGSSRAATGDQAAAARVAVDTETLKPLLLETLVDGQATARTAISLIETVDPSGVDFSRPKQLPARESPTGTTVTGEQTVTAAAAARALDGLLLTAGPSLNGLLLETITVQQIATGYGPSSRLAPLNSRGVELVYGKPRRLDTQGDWVILRQSLRPEMLYWRSGRPRVPPQGSMLVWSASVSAVAPGSTRALPTGETIWYGQLHTQGVYVAIEATGKALLVDAARSLTTEETK